MAEPWTPQRQRQAGDHPPRRQKHGGAMQTLLTSGDNPRIIRKIVKFYAGGVVPPRPASAPGVRRGSWAMVTMGAVESRGSTTPPALNSANYPTIRALTYAVYIVYRPPACLLAPLQLWPPACFVEGRGFRMPHKQRRPPEGSLSFVRELCRLQHHLYGCCG